MPCPANGTRPMATPPPTVSALRALLRSRSLLDFTYFLDDPIHGDQFEQQDNRFTSLAARQPTLDPPRYSAMTPKPRRACSCATTISITACIHTEDSSVSALPPSIDITETSASPYLENQTHWTPWLRTILGLRSDAYLDGCDNLAGGNSGNVQPPVCQSQAQHRLRALGQDRILSRLRPRLSQQ